jgi:hypothetical protein
MPKFVQLAAVAATPTGTSSPAPVANKRVETPAIARLARNLILFFVGIAVGGMLFAGDDAPSAGGDNNTLCSATNNGVGVAQHGEQSGAYQTMADPETTRDDIALQQKLFTRGGGWRYDEGMQCDETLLEVTLTEPEVKHRQLYMSTLQQLRRAFRACGVVVIHNAWSGDEVDAYAAGVQQELEPYVHSRKRLRDFFVAALSKAKESEEIQNGGDLQFNRDVWSHRPVNASAEPFIRGSRAGVYREWSAGRMDLTLVGICFFLFFFCECSCDVHVRSLHSAHVCTVSEVRTAWTCH